MEKLDNIINKGTKNSPYKIEGDIYGELKSIKDFINRQHSACEGIFICRVDQLTGLFMRATLIFNGLTSKTLKD